MNSHSSSSGQKKNSSQHQKQIALEHAIRDLETLSPIFHSKKIKELLEKAAFAPDKSKEDTMESIAAGKMDDLTLQLLVLVSKIYDLYQVSYKNQQGEVDVVIRTATRLSKEQEQEFLEKIQQKRGADTKVRFEYDPSLIGGVQIYEKDSFVDYSLKNGIEKLEKQFK